MATRLTHRGRIQEPAQVGGEPSTIIIVAVVAGVVAMIILLWVWLG